MNSTVHRLLQKQIERSTREDGRLDVDLLTRLVSDAYAESDLERRRTDRSIALMVEELDQFNARLMQVVARRTDELEQLHRRLEATLQNVDQGIVMIDPDGCIAVFNEKFVEMTGLPRSAFEGSPRFRTIVERMLDAGEFDPMGDAFKAWVMRKGSRRGPVSFQRIRPNGVVLQVQALPMPDGGEVRTLSDVTAHVRKSDELRATRDMFEMTLNNVTQGIMKVDASGKVLFFNRRVVELLGFPDGLMKEGVTIRELIRWQYESGDFEGQPDEVIDRVREGDPGPELDCYTRRRPNGTIIQFNTIRLQDGSFVRTFTDITEARAREEAIARVHEEYRSLFENSTVGIFRSTLDGRQLRANPALVRMNGYESEDEMLTAVNDIAQEWYVDPKRRQEFTEIMEREGRTTDFVSEVYRHKTRERIWVSEASWLVRDKDGKPAYYEGMVIDATERMRTEAEIAHLALHDMLTRLPNRSLFLNTLSAALEDNRRGHEIAVLCLDLDHFKDVNDTMGHDCGDILLRMASRRLMRTLPKRGMAARFGGDEFALILPDVRDRDSVVALARQIVQLLSKPYRIRGSRVYVGASVGIAVAPGDGIDAHDLLKKADIALYRAKRDGRGTYACFDEGMTAAILARREIEVDLRRAIVHNEFELHYQPIIDLETNRPHAFEALIRWRHPQKGLLMPAYFIDIAEESGLILQIGELVLRQACETMARMPSDVSVSVNLSPIQFRNHQLAVSVVNALAASSLSPHRLVLEITESVLMADDYRTVDILRQLRMLGVRIALDDFGVGHSSLSYLQKFPFNKIKIDKSFVQNNEDGTMNTAIRRAILSLGQDIGIDVIVEGVETETQRDMLIYEGCRYVQGYLFGRPRPEADIIAEFGPALGMARTMHRVA
ncbi:MAG: EAL domain-containing protein [Beijerinckiaceae bacterium]|nr:EAL domain-containing protein [Beijerinckiaceae bacterium]MCZ8299090.1 EAL domain-containing protein [Beijerinckiaceae bacterium]